MDHSIFIHFFLTLRHLEFDANNFNSRLIDSCIILRLGRPLALLLLDTLAQAIQDEGNPSIKSMRSVSNGKQALKDQGIRKLGIEDALSVLRRKIV